MNTEHIAGAAAPAFEEGRVVTHVILPAAATYLHERGAPYASALAEAWGVPLRLVHVSESVSSTDPALDAVVDNLRHRRPGLVIESANVYGDDVATALADYVEPHAFVVMTTEHADEWRFKDSVAEAVVHHVGAPLLLLGPNATDVSLTGEIVVGVDGSYGSETAVGYALKLAQAFGVRTRVWLIRIVPAPARGETVHHPEISDQLQHMAEENNGPADVRWEIIQSNDPVHALVDFARRRKASFIVAGARTRTDATRTSMGSVTMGLVHAATQAVMPVSSPQVEQLPGAGQV
jgi:nucleotide-binding universal stress UspA family protein